MEIETSHTSKGVDARVELYHGGDEHQQSDELQADHGDDEELIDEAIWVKADEGDHVHVGGQGEEEGGEEDAGDEAVIEVEGETEKAPVKGSKAEELFKRRT
ncbi:hypothetical protein TYRP_005416 [Tyrophagus putrescentiae]|nr:hypothetical protein TYRP_005416 [Tyrophagus putrescentiae]